jgi:hypothetical protein
MFVQDGFLYSIVTRHKLTVCIPVAVNGSKFGKTTVLLGNKNGSVMILKI